MDHLEFCFSLCNAGPRLGHEAAGRQATRIEPRPQDQVPALATDTDQPHPRGAAVPPRWPQECPHVGPGAGRPARRGLAPPTEPSHRGHRYRPPHAGRALGSGPAGARPRPAPACGNLEARFAPGPHAVPTGFAALGRPSGQADPRRLVALRPAGPPGAGQAAGPTHTGGPAPLPTGARGRRKAAQRLAAGAGRGPQGPPRLDRPAGRPPPAPAAPRQPAGLPPPLGHHRHGPGGGKGRAERAPQPPPLPAPGLFGVARPHGPGPGKGAAPRDHPARQPPTLCAPRAGSGCPRPRVPLPPPPPPASQGTPPRG